MVRCGFFGCAIALLSFELASVEDARAQLVGRDWNTEAGNWNVPANWTPERAR